MSDKINQLQETMGELLAEAKRQGASSAEAGVHGSHGLALNVRLGEIETIEHTNDQGLGVTVYFGQRKGNANTTDLSPAAVKETVAAACRIAKYTSEDPATGLADAHMMASNHPDLDLNHPWDVSTEDAIVLATECEDAARGYDPRINNSEGASVHTHNSLFVYGNSHGFVGGYPSTRHSISCAVLGQEGDDMQRDYWFSNARHASELDSPKSIGDEAARRTLSRLGSHKIKTTECPVIFSADVAPSLMRSFFGAIRGGVLYREASFLLDHLGKPIFPDWVTIDENPLLMRGLASAPFDSEGVATKARNIIEDGILTNYLLDSYSARQLKTPNTGNAGGVRNARINSSGESFDELVKKMNSGLIVTELMGSGANTVTGDYSRGAAGFWVENGEIQHPVEEITVAGNLKQMLMGLSAIATDNHNPGSINTGSWLIDKLTVAGN